MQAFLLDRVSRTVAAWSPNRRRHLAVLLGSLTREVLGIRRRYVQEQLTNRLGLSPQAAERLGRRLYACFLENALEMATIPFLTAEQVKGRLEPKGLEHLDAALQRGRGVILISGHYGLWELVPPWLALHGYKMTVVVRRQSNPLVDDWFEAMRQKHGVETTDSGYSLRGSLRALKNGHILGLMSDQDAGDRGIFVRFLGDWASAPVGPAQIAQRTGAPLVPVAGHRCGGGPHVLEIFPPIFPEAFSASPEGWQAMTQAYTDIIAGWVQRRPEQWFWLHRRWKTRPPSPQSSPPSVGRGSRG